ncbi:MAG: hypothetical protein IPG50_30700 [Myxococcales bacterium]|nr:hypothetical protein [Myxococcales bacterium]
MSLFDVSNLATHDDQARHLSAPAGASSEDQDRVHKAVRVVDDEGLILVPFASYGSERFDGGPA